MGSLGDYLILLISAVQLLLREPFITDVAPIPHNLHFTSLLDGSAVESAVIELGRKEDLDGVTMTLAFVSQELFRREKQSRQVLHYCIFHSISVNHMRRTAQSFLLGNRFAK